MRAIRAEDASLLSQTGWLSHIPVDCQDAVLDECLCYVTNAGQAITHGGEETGGMFGIISGTVGVYSAVGSSEAPLIHIAGPAFWFGLYPITNGRPRIISVTARTPCMIAQLPETALRTLLDRRPEMWRWLNLLSLESSALAVQALADLLISDKDRRCAAVMLRIAGCRENGDASANASLTQDDLAALSNLSRPTVSLIVRRLAARGFVSPGYKMITINTPAQLRSFVG